MIVFQLIGGIIKHFHDGMPSNRLKRLSPDIHHLSSSLRPFEIQDRDPGLVERATYVLEELKLICNVEYFVPVPLWSHFFGSIRRPAKLGDVKRVKQIYDSMKGDQYFDKVNSP